MSNWWQNIVKGYAKMLILIRCRISLFGLFKEKEILVVFGKRRRQCLDGVKLLSYWWMKARKPGFDFDFNHW